MRVLIISDVHANRAALDEVLADAEGQKWLGRKGFDAVWSVGDIVGYGPHPNDCIERLRAFEGHLRVAGNHDWAALGRLDVEDFNPQARQMVIWTQEQLGSLSQAYLDKLPSTPQVRGEYTVTHASPREPVWEYVRTPGIARDNFEYFDTTYCIVGHTHVPQIYRLAENPTNGRTSCTAYAPVYDKNIVLAGDHRLILNPGSVGQPRDGDYRAAYAMLDTEQGIWRFRRVSYAYEITQADMRQAGLPERLIVRLAYGW
jgi:predicted phosphodiesterase